jgi:hypothetical protein
VFREHFEARGRDFNQLPHLRNRRKKVCISTKPEEGRVEWDASVERNASSRATIAVAVSADLISALRIASNSLAAVLQVLAHSRFENAVVPGCERFRSLDSSAEREEGPFGMI